MTLKYKRTAIRRKELERYEDLTDEQLTGLPEDEFYDLTDAVMSDLARMEDMVKRRKQMFDRIKKQRLAAELEKTKGKVVDLTDMVMMLTEQAGRTSWAKLLAELKQMRPELSDLLDELQERFTDKPVPMVKKYRRSKEPKKWKSMEHVPLKSVGRTAESDMESHRVLRRLNDFLDKWIDRLGYFLEESLSRAASARIAEISQDTMAVLNVNAGAKKAAAQIMQSVSEAINNMVTQAKPLGDSVDTAPFGVVQNMGALLDDWAQTLTQLKTTTVDSVLQQLTEIGEKLEKDLAAGGRVEAR